VKRIVVVQAFRTRETDRRSAGLQACGAQTFKPPVSRRPKGLHYMSGH